MTSLQIILAIGALAIVTQASRQLPLFVRVSPVWEYRLQSIKASLAFTLMSLLCFYSVRGTHDSWPQDWKLQIIGVGVTVLVHVYFKNIYLSVALGTLVYLLF